jgi:hypothetical protein
VVSGDARGTPPHLRVGVHHGIMVEPRPVHRVVYIHQHLGDIVEEGLRPLPYRLPAVTRGWEVLQDIGVQCISEGSRK